jgi:hypothetical protein
MISAALLFEFFILAPVCVRQETTIPCVIYIYMGLTFLSDEELYRSCWSLLTPGIIPPYPQNLPRGRVFSCQTDEAVCRGNGYGKVLSLNPADRG